MTIDLSTYACFLASMFFVIAVAIGTTTYSGLLAPSRGRQLVVFAILVPAFVTVGLALWTEGRSYVAASLVLFGLVFLIGGWQSLREPMVGLEG